MIIKRTPDGLTLRLSDLHALGEAALERGEARTVHLQVEDNARLRAKCDELIAALKSCRLLLYAWRGSRIDFGLMDDHRELNEMIAEIERLLQGTKNESSNA